MPAMNAMTAWSTKEVIKAPEVRFALIRYYLQGIFAYPNKKQKLLMQGYMQFPCQCKKRWICD
jgi:hypothetical protein